MLVESAIRRPDGRLSPSRKESSPPADPRMPTSISGGRERRLPWAARLPVRLRHWRASRMRHPTTPRRSSWPIAQGRCLIGCPHPLVLPFRPYPRRPNRTVWSGALSPNGQRTLCLWHYRGSGGRQLYVTASVLGNNGVPSPHGTSPGNRTTGSSRRPCPTPPELGPRDGRIFSVAAALRRTMRCGGPFGRGCGFPGRSRRPGDWWPWPAPPAGGGPSPRAGDSPTSSSWLPPTSTMAWVICAALLQGVVALVVQHFWRNFLVRSTTYCGVLMYRFAAGSSASMARA